MKRYNSVYAGSYTKPHEMVEEKDGDWVKWEDVQDCAKCAELLDACKSALTAMKNNDWNEHDIVFIGLRNAIAKAEGAQP